VLRLDAGSAIADAGAESPVGQGNVQLGWVRQPDFGAKAHLPTRVEVGMAAGVPASGSRASGA
jgi:hypothetical protein